MYVMLSIMDGAAWCKIIWRKLNWHG